MAEDSPDRRTDTDATSAPEPPEKDDAYRPGKRWGFLILAAVSAVPAYVWINLAAFIRTESCEYGRCENGGGASAQLGVAVVAVVIWMLALGAGWLRLEWSFVVLAVLAIAIAVAWLPVVALTT
jgi:hypothetical protein